MLAMGSLPERIVKHAEALPESHLGQCAPSIDKAILPTLSTENLEELSNAPAIMPIWMAEPVSAPIAHG